MSSLPQPAESLPIIATMLCGNNEAIVADAVRSVIAWVDTFLLIDTGIGDRSLEIVRDLTGTKLWVEKFEWRNDFAKARNFALELAGSRGAAWALTIDTDERIDLGALDGREAIRTKLASDPKVFAWLVSAKDGSYAKERFIRVPSHLEWRGRTHESLSGARSGDRMPMSALCFWEEPKTSAQTREKLERDLRVLREETTTHPEHARWWLYLGQTLEALGQYEEAVESYRLGARLKSAWSEDAAWSAYCGARCLVALKRFEEATELCAIGLSRQPASPELAWQAGYCCYQLGRFQEAVTWEQMAIAIGNMEGSHAAQTRISFRHLPAWYDAPYDVLRHSYRMLGDVAAATACERKHQEAMTVRALAMQARPSPRTPSRHAEPLD
jgi:tetratricopeptide (TPR) repeat protein